MSGDEGDVFLIDLQDHPMVFRLIFGTGEHSGTLSLARARVNRTGCLR